jgi:hypothetical protein
MKTLKEFISEQLGSSEPESPNLLLEGKSDSSSKFKYEDSQGLKAYNLFRELSVDPEKFERKLRK